MRTGFRRIAVAFSLFAALVLGPRVLASGNLSAPLTIDTRPASQDRVEFLGDSFIEWFGNSPGLGGGMFSLLAASIQQQQIHAQGLAQHDSRLIPIIQDGASGTGMAHVAANVNARVIAHAPTIVFYLLSRNDLGTNLTTWATNATSAFNAVDAALPHVRVAFISALGGLDERWDTAVGWDPSIGSNGAVANLNNAAQTWIAGRDQTRYIYLDLRGSGTSPAPNTELAYEMAHNASPVVGTTVGVSLGIMLNGSGHPIAGPGQKAFGDLLSAGFLTVVY